MDPEQEAAELIRTLESIIEDLRTIASGKNYTRTQAREELYGIKLALGAESAEC